MFLREDYIKLSEAVFMLLSYYGHHNIMSLDRLNFSPIKLHVFCVRIPDHILNKCPFIVRQAINYVRSLNDDCSRKFELLDV